jgi:outer membrane protein assembly factor BamB
MPFFPFSDSMPYNSSNKVSGQLYSTTERRGPVWFRRPRHSNSIPEESNALLSFEVGPLESAKDKRSISSRALIQGLTFMVVVALLAVSIPLWVSPLQRLWGDVFPPPPYTGSLVFTEEGEYLTARHMTDGGIQWRLPLAGINSGAVQYGNALYVTPYSDQAIHVEKLRAQDGHLLWQFTRQGYDQFFVLGLRGTHLIGWYQNGPTGKGRAVALDDTTGRTLWVTPEMTDAQGNLAGNELLLCQDNARSDGQPITYGLSSVDLLTGKQRWSQTITLKQSAPFNGYNCGATATVAFLLINPSQPGELEAFDLATGAPRWHIPVTGYLTAYDLGVAFFSTWIGGGESNSATGDRLSAVRIADGSLLWSIPGQYVPLVGNGISELIRGGVVLVHAAEGLAGIAASTGTVLWSWPGHAPAGLPDWDVVSNGGNVLYYADEGGIAAIDASTRQVLWQDIIANAATLSISGRQLFASDQQSLMALDATTGRVHWHAPTAAQAQFVYCLLCSS